jgi:hypothetical protein
MRFDSRTPHGAPAASVQGVASYYRASYGSIRVEPLAGWTSRLGTYQKIVRLHEQLVIPLLILALLGVILAPGPTRAGIGLVLAFALALYMVPAITALWDARFGVLPGELLALAATVGSWQLWLRFRRPTNEGSS